MLTRWIISGALLLIAGGAHAQYQYKTDYYSGNVRGSELTFRQQLKNVELHLPKCATESRVRRYDVAAAHCTFILNYFPNHPWALFHLSQICDAWKDPRCDPEPYFENAIAVNPKAANTYIVKGIYLLRLKKVLDAIDNLKRAVELDANSSNAHYNLALAYFDAKQFDLSNQHAQLAYRLGAPLPGLRERLKKAGQWRPEDGALPHPPQSSSSSPPSSP